MKIEILYPEIANLFGDLANIKYIKSSIPDCKVIGTDLSTKPRFLTEKDVDLVYMGTMTENSQIVAMEHLEPYKDEIKTAIETGQRFLMTGNAFEIFCKDITDLDDLPVDRFPERVDVENKVTRCLGIFDINVKRAVMHRLNSLYMGKFGDLDVVGFKSVFTYAEPRAIIPPMFETVKGPGLDKTSMGEGTDTIRQQVTKTQAAVFFREQGKEHCVSFVPFIIPEIIYINKSAKNAFCKQLHEPAGTVKCICVFRRVRWLTEKKAGKHRY